LEIRLRRRCRAVGNLSIEGKTTMNAEARIAELKLELPPAPKPVATYVPVVQVGNLVYVSGHGPLRPDKSLVTGVVGADLTEEQGYESARVTGLAVLATLRNYLGSLDRVVRLVKVLGMVNAAPNFERHPFVINGFSDLMVEVFGEPGKGARSAVGMGSLPGRIATEVEAIFEVRDAKPVRPARKTKKPAAKTVKRVAKKKRR
jgi:enamine deaminase RidA (YjgF/YER057c/UK114 family)